MIRGLHGLFYSSEVDAMRAFLRDKLLLPFTDVGEGWLIFDLPEADLGVHPVEDAASSGKHDLSFYCDDIEGTVADLRARGVTFDSEVADHGYGYVTYFTMPGQVRVQLYEPKYEKRSSKPATAPRKRAATVRAAARPRARAKAAAKVPARATTPSRAAKAKARSKAPTRAKPKSRPKAGARARRR